MQIKINLNLTKVDEIFSWRNLKLKKFEIWSWKILKFEVEEILNLKLKKIEGEEIWSCRNFMLNKFEVEEIWSWKNLKLKRSGRYLKLKNFELKNWAFLGVREGFKNCFEVYSCSWMTFISYVFLNSDFCFWLNFGVSLYFLGP